MNDETMTLRGTVNMGIHPVIANQRMFATVCDNFLLNPDGTGTAAQDAAEDLRTLIS